MADPTGEGTTLGTERLSEGTRDPVPTRGNVTQKHKSRLPTCNRTVGEFRSLSDTTRVLPHHRRFDLTLPGSRKLEPGGRVDRINGPKGLRGSDPCLTLVTNPRRTNPHRGTEGVGGRGTSGGTTVRDSLGKARRTGIPDESDTVQRLYFSCTPVHTSIPVHRPIPALLVNSSLCGH